MPKTKRPTGPKPIAVHQAIDALSAIAGTLDGTEWSVDTPDEIAAILRGLGCKIRDVVTRRRRPGKMPAVHAWAVIIEWNDRPPSEWTGDPGLVGIYGSEQAAETAAQEERKNLDATWTVHAYTNAAGSHCIGCGERNDDGHQKVCKADPEAEEYCDHCGAELKDTGSCDNDHDEWDLDVHVREATIET